MEEQEIRSSISRRRVLKRAGAGAVIVWSAPVLTSLGAAHAQNGTPPPNGDPNGDTGSITGQVTDATTGDPIAGAVVSADTGQSDTTGSDGLYELTNVPAGDRMVTASATGYTSASSTVTVPAGGTAVENFSLSPSGDVTAVLTWNTVVSDLDLHMSGPDGSGGRFHVNWQDTAHSDYVTLDRDDVDGEGPETIRVTVSPSNGGQWVAGSYHVWVHSFSEEDFDLSDAVVRLNDQSTQRGEFEAANATGDSEQDIWLVVHFDLDSAGVMSNVLSQQTFTAGDDDSVF